MDRSPSGSPTFAGIGSCWVGNLAGSGRGALFLMNYYPQRSRLKILGHATVIAASDDAELARRLTLPQMPPAERLVRIDVLAFDWNCPKYITPRYTKAELDELMAPLKKRIAELESKGEAGVRK